MLFILLIFKSLVNTVRYKNDSRAFGINFLFLLSPSCFPCSPLIDTQPLCTMYCTTFINFLCSQTISSVFKSLGCFRFVCLSVVSIHSARIHSFPYIPPKLSWRITLNVCTIAVFRTCNNDLT